MITQEEVVRFFKNNAALAVSTVAAEAGVSPETMRKVMTGKRDLNEKHLKALYPVLVKYGYKSPSKKCQVISVANHKGGTGKTTTTMNLGAALAMLGKQVLLIDVDPQFNLTQYCGVEEEDITDSILETFTENKPLPVLPVDKNLYLVPAELALTRAETSIASNITSYMKLKNALQPLKATYDYVLIDCPPSLSFFTTNAIMASDSIIIPLETEHLARKGLNSIIEYIDEIRQNGLNSEIELMGILLTKVNHTVISRTTADFINHKYAKNTFKTVIRDNVTLAESSAGAENIHKYSPRSYGAQDYLNLAKEITQYG